MTRHAPSEWPDAPRASLSLTPGSLLMCNVTLIGLPQLSTKLTVKKPSQLHSLLKRNVSDFFVKELDMAGYCYCKSVMS